MNRCVIKLAKTACKLLRAILMVLAVLLVFGMLVHVNNNTVTYIRQDRDVSDQLDIGVTIKCPSEARRDHMIQKCEERGLSHDLNYTFRHDYWRLLVDDNHKVLYCVIPKVACSSFKTFIARHADANKTSALATKQGLSVHGVRFLNSLGLGYLSQHFMGDINEKLTNYRKYIVVRHPFNRLISAYSDKFIKGRYYPKHYQRLFEKIYQDGVKHDRQGLVRPTFTQFLTMLTHFYQSKFIDKHWMSYYDLCHPCSIKYDDIIKIETLSEDLPSFTNRFAGSSMEMEEAFPTLNNNTNFVDNLAETSRIFYNVDPGIVKKLMKIYQNDFELFGYTWSRQHGAGCGLTEDELMDCC